MGGTTQGATCLTYGTRTATIYNEQWAGTLLACTAPYNKKGMNRLFSILCGAVAAALLLPTLTGCAESEYSNYYCRLTLDNNRMKNHTLAEAMTQYSNVFCRISREGDTRYKFESNHGGEPTYFPLTDTDRKQNFTIGIYNGVIIGFGNDGKFYAYDNQCADCYRGSGMPRYPLTMNADGTATCKSCHRVFDLKYGGNLVKGDKSKKGLECYYGNTTGAYGILNVNNF